MEYPNAIIEDTLLKFKGAMGPDYDKYRNHVYPVFLNCLLIDSKKYNTDRYAIAAVFHNIGIWTNHTFDYFKPSIEQATIYLTETNKTAWHNEISLMIYWHHKISKYKGEHVELVETFRQADWIDVSLAVLTFKLDRHEINKVRKRFPDRGFHIFLLKETIKNVFRHPLNPLPVFKK